MVMCPAAIGEIKHTVDGKWLTFDLKEKILEVLFAGPVLCITTNGVDLGSGFDFANGNINAQVGHIAPTLAGVNEIKSVPDLLTTSGHFYEVLVSYDRTGKSGR